MRRLSPLLLLWLLLGANPIDANTEPGYQLAVVKMDETGVVLELRLNDFTLEKRQHEGVTYHLVGSMHRACIRCPSLGSRNCPLCPVC